MKETRFKDTEIGRIPEDWEVVKLENKGTLLRGSINPQMFPQKHFVEYSMPSFDNGCTPEVKVGLSMQSGRTCIKSPVLLYNKLNVRQRRIWYIDTCPNDSICSMEFLPYVSDKIDLCCLKYFVNTDKVTSDFIGMSKGTSNSQKRIAPSDFLEYKIGLPKHKGEQSRIASALSSIDNLISSLDKLIEKKKNIKQGTMQQLLTGKKRLKGFNEPWVEKKIEELCSVNRGVRVVKKDLTQSGMYPVFQNTNYPLGYLDRFNVELDTPFVIIGGSAGQVGICHTNYWAADDCAYFECKKVLNVFMYLVLLLNQRQILNNVRNGTVPRLDRAFLCGLTVSVPSSIDEQYSIASVLTSMDNEISSLEAKKAKYESIKQGMMQQLLTGKIRLI